MKFTGKTMYIYHTHRDRQVRIKIYYFQVGKITYISKRQVSMKFPKHKSMYLYIGLREEGVVEMLDE